MSFNMSIPTMGKEDDFGNIKNKLSFSTHSSIGNGKHALLNLNISFCSRLYSIIHSILNFVMHRPQNHALPNRMSCVTTSST